MSHNKKYIFLYRLSMPFYISVESKLATISLMYFYYFDELNSNLHRHVVCRDLLFLSNNIV